MENHVVYRFILASSDTITCWPRKEQKHVRRDSTGQTQRQCDEEDVVQAEIWKRYPLEMALFAISRLEELSILRCV